MAATSSCGAIGLAQHRLSSTRARLDGSKRHANAERCDPCTVQVPVPSVGKRTWQACRCPNAVQPELLTVSNTFLRPAGPDGKGGPKPCFGWKGRYRNGIDGIDDLPGTLFLSSARIGWRGK